MLSIEDSFRILEIRPDSSLDDAKTAYREMAQVWHPDRFSSSPHLRIKAEERMKRINEAFEVLKVHYVRSRSETHRTGSGSQAGDQTDYGTSTSAGVTDEQVREQALRAVKRWQQAFSLVDEACKRAGCTWNRSADYLRLNEVVSKLETASSALAMRLEHEIKQECENTLRKGIDALSREVKERTRQAQSARSACSAVRNARLAAPEIKDRLVTEARSQAEREKSRLVSAPPTSFQFALGGWLTCNVWIWGTVLYFVLAALQRNHPGNFVFQLILTTYSIAWLLLAFGGALLWPLLRYLVSLAANSAKRSAVDRALNDSISEAESHARDEAAQNERERLSKLTECEQRLGEAEADLRRATDALAWLETSLAAAN